MSPYSHDNARLAALVARLEGRRLRRIASRPFRALSRLKSTVPDRLLIAPQDIRTADPTVATDIYAGHFVLGGALVDTHGRSPFDLDAVGPAWSQALHGFGWLRHLRAADTPSSRANARALVQDWITRADGSRQSVAWQPAVVARRLLSWLSHSPMILNPPDGAFYRQFMRSIGRQTAFLQRRLPGRLEGSDRLIAAIAVAEAGLCAEGLAGARKTGSRILVEELNRQILPDGGHIGRNPSLLIDLLLDMLPLRQAYAARGAPVPPALLNAIDRMMPMLRLFRHGDGTLALFNGMGVTEPDLIATVLAHDDARARPLTNAPHSGYQRFETLNSLLICDVGRPPPRPFSSQAHAGTLAFEFSAGRHRLVVNCGRPNNRNRQANEAARSTPAHSTLVLADTSSSLLAPPRFRRWFGEEIVAGPRVVTVERGEAAGHLTLDARHDGYARAFGLLHRRRLSLSPRGDRLEGEDEIVPGSGSRGTPPGSAPFVVRFHLHPNARPQPRSDGSGVDITLPNGEQWLFEADGRPVAIEESILFAVAEGTRRTGQLVIQGRWPDDAKVSWSFGRL